ncbi:hypothetical protein CWC29_014310 [Pseudoalteromonas sp. S4498]|uniref:winged helix DNA-binding domain-containing protein n=1 Tax=Pseudoalteromonas galatheae TaxID=579562 RepID=UPI0011086077|nr:winged helix DNA-binding domain-containing protein [Pseudoalteromonas galatheae]NKC19986.1 hypothetical protein [Pseudoalteromonas galatheae]
MKITLNDLKWHRMKRSGLITPFKSAEDCAESLIGIQAQMPRAAALSIANRVVNFSFLEFENLLYDSGSLIRTWGQRHTLHVYRSTDWPNIIPAICNRRSWAYKNFKKDGGSDSEYERLLHKIGEILETGKPLLRSEISAYTGVSSSAWGGLLIDAAYRGLVYDAGKKRFSHGKYRGFVNDKSLSKRQAGIQLVTRYLYSYGPASLADIAFWFGEKVGVIENLMSFMDLMELECSGIKLYMLRKEPSIISSLENQDRIRSCPIIMLYRFDPLLLAHKSKEWIVPREHYNKVWTAGGHVSGVVVVKGTAVAKWHYIKKGKKYIIEVEPFSNEKISTEVREKALEHERFLEKFFDANLKSAMRSV